MQVFRLMGIPDKVIGFDELPKEYTDGLEMHDSSKLGRVWRDFIGKRERIIQIKPELDPITRQWRTFSPVRESSYFTYIIDSELNADKEKWGEILQYVRRNAPMTWKQTGSDGQEVSIKLMDEIEKMAKPLAKDAHSELDLEPEDVIVIPLKKVSDEKTEDGPTVSVANIPQGFTCGDCGKNFDSEHGLSVHSSRLHKKVEA